MKKTLLTLVLLLVYSTGTQAQFRPFELGCGIKDIEVIDGRVFVFGAISGFGYSMSGDSGIGDGFQLLRIDNNDVDTAYSYISYYPSPDTYRNWSYGLWKEGNSTVYRTAQGGYHGSSEWFGIIGIDQDSLKTSQSLYHNLGDRLFSGRVTLLGNCGDSVNLWLRNGVVERAKSRHGQRFDNLSIIDSIDTVTVSRLDYNGVEALLQEGGLVRRTSRLVGCDWNSRQLLNLPDSVTTIHYGPHGTILGWTGMRVAYSVDHGASWSFSLPLMLPDSARNVRVWRTLDSAFIVSATMPLQSVDDVQYPRAHCYVLLPGELDWSHSRTSHSSRTSAIAGDFIREVAVAYSGNAGFYLTNETGPFLWKYDPTVSVIEPALDTSPSACFQPGTTATIFNVLGQPVKTLTLEGDSIAPYQLEGLPIQPLWAVAGDCVKRVR